MRGPSRRCAESRCGLKNGVQLAAHIADAGHAISEKERENQVTSISGGVIEVHVGVHIPQARDEVFPLGIDNLSWVGIATSRWSNAGDAVSANRYRAVRLCLARDRVDDRYVGDGERLRPRTER